MNCKQFHAALHLDRSGQSRPQCCMVRLMPHSAEGHSGHHIGAGMLSVLRKEWKRFPVTMSMVTLAIVLFVAVRWRDARDETESLSVLRDFGCSMRLSNVEIDEAGNARTIDGLSGFFDVWDGEVWRLAVNAWHHDGILHLIMNLIGLWYLGRLTEARMYRLLYAAFFVSGCTLSILPEILLGNQAIGISGGVYALLGLLAVARFGDFRLQLELTTGVIIACIAALFLCVVLTYSEVMHIANAAHFTGVFYGCCAGAAFYLYRWPLLRRMTQMVFVGLHALAAVGIWYATHPVWLGEYYWYLARNRPVDDGWRELMQATVERDPSLLRPWRELLVFDLENSRDEDAWSTAARALSHHRTDRGFVECLQRLRVLALHDDNKLRRQDFLFHDVFGNEVADWRNVLWLDEPESLTERLPVLATLVFKQFVEDRSDSHSPSKSPDPNDPQSAMEGVTL